MNFKELVRKYVRKVPYGKLVSYGQVAAACGSPRAARQVGWTLHTLDGDKTVPWWRVINTQGFISIKGNLISTPLAQKKLIEAEGIPVTEDLKIDLEKYRHYYSPMPKLINSSKSKK